MSIFLNGIDAKYITLQADKTLTPGKPCTIKADGSVTDSVEDDWFLGVTKGVRGELASVQISGFVTVPCTGNIPAPGFQYLCADGKGGMKIADFGGRELLIVENDKEAGTIGLFL